MTNNRPVVIQGFDLAQTNRVLLCAPDVLDGDDLEQIAKGLREWFPDIEFYILGGGFQAVVLNDEAIIGEINE